jgi:hypothetical protein
MLLHIVVRAKMCLFGNEHSRFAARYFHFAASMLCPLDEQLPEDGLVRPKHVATKCDLNDILK